MIDDLMVLIIICSGLFTFNVLYLTLTQVTSRLSVILPAAIAAASVMIVELVYCVR